MTISTRREIDNLEHTRKKITNKRRTPNLRDLTVQPWPTSTGHNMRTAMKGEII